MYVLCSLQGIKKHKQFYDTTRPEVFLEDVDAPLTPLMRIDFQRPFKIQFHV